VPDIAEQSCGDCQPLAPPLQTAVSPINIVLPDRIRFYYSGDDGRGILQDIDVHALGENAHGVCFLLGAQRPDGAAEPDAAAAATAFRIDLIDGMLTRVATGETLPAQLWERRVRRRFATDRNTDALPLSSMLITTKEGGHYGPD
jgi:hypothetical protein